MCEAEEVAVGIVCQGCVDSLFGVVVVEEGAEVWQSLCACCSRVVVVVDADEGSDEDDGCLFVWHHDCGCVPVGTGFDIGEIGWGFWGRCGVVGEGCAECAVECFFDEPGLFDAVKDAGRHEVGSVGFDVEAVLFPNGLGERQLFCHLSEHYEHGADLVELCFFVVFRDGVDGISDDGCGGVFCSGGPPAHGVAG